MHDAPVRRAIRAADRLLGWSVGMPLATLRFLTRRTDLVDREVPAGPDGPDDPRTVRRRYRARIERPRLPASTVAAVVLADPNVVLPVEVMHFSPGGAKAGPLRAGEDRLIRMAGPWNGPVRIVEAGEEGFAFAGLHGGAQRGRIAYRLRDDDGAIEAEVEIVQRSASRLYDLAYHRLGIARRIERHTWTYVLERSAQLAGGRPPERVLVETLVSRPPRPPGRRSGALRRMARRGRRR
jgi:hypothetical protein